MGQVCEHFITVGITEEHIQAFEVQGIDDHQRMLFTSKPAGNLVVMAEIGQAGEHVVVGVMGDANIQAVDAGE